MLIVSCDLGQKTDWTALCVLEAKPETLDLRHLGRVRNVDYPAVVREISRLYASLPHPKALILDYTGVGRAAVDMIRLQHPEALGLTITAGRAPKRTPDGICVPKRLLVQSLAGALESGQLRFAGGIEYLSELQHELAAFTAKIRKNGRTAFEGRGSHDDFVMAVSYGVWLAANQLWHDTGIMRSSAAAVSEYHT